MIVFMGEITKPISKWGGMINSLIVAALILCNCSSKETEDFKMMSCDWDECVIQKTNDDLVTKSPRSNSKGKSFESSTVRIYYDDEKKRKVLSLIIENGDIINYISFDDTIGVIQSVASRKRNEEYYFSLFNDSGEYKIEKTKSMFPIQSK